MNFLSEVKKGLNEPKLIIGEINQQYRHFFRNREKNFNVQGINILDQDWDNLLILDACRYDYFEQSANKLPGRLSKVTSRGSATIQFLRANFSEKDLFDTVYVTANPQLFRIQNEIYEEEPINVRFYKQIEVWRDNWHENHKTVLPDVVTNMALETAANHPEKKLIVHYLQPHAPFIGRTGVENLPTKYLNFWHPTRRYDFSREIIRKAYEENLELVLPHVETLMRNLRGLTVVTSDHGELLGDRDFPIPIRTYGHPPHNYHSSLIEVPWLEYQNGERRDITATPPDKIDMYNDEFANVESKLKHLGYK
jgi:hypothetical protein